MVSSSSMLLTRQCPRFLQWSIYTIEFTVSFLTQRRRHASGHTLSSFHVFNPIHPGDAIVQAKPGGVDLKPSPWRPITLGGHRRRWALFLQGWWWLKAQVAHELADPFTSDRSVLLAQGVIEPTIPVVGSDAATAWTQAPARP